MDNLLSIVIPSRNEPFLNKTLEDLLAKAEGEIEIIVSLDGYWPDPILNDDRVIYIHKGKPEGMRAGINSCVAMARGKYVMKIDAHCMIDQGFDVKLKANCEPNWVCVPRRLRLEPESWTFKDTDKDPIDYEYLSFPNNDQDWGGAGLHGRKWESKNRDLKLREKMIDDQMSAQGSFWFMHRDYFYELELMDDKNYGTFWQEFQEIGLKCWLSGGRVIVNKNTWYAHWHKGKLPSGKNVRSYRLDTSELEKGTAYTNKWITEKVWHKQIHDLSWLVEKFWPVPTWPEDRKLWQPSA